MTTRVRKIADVPDVEAFISLDTAKAQCRVDVPDEDALIGMYIDVAMQSASNRLQRTLMPAVYRLTLGSFQDAIDLLMPPIMSVQSVKYIDVNDQQQTLGTQDYVVDLVSEPGRIFPSSSTGGWPQTKNCANAVEVEYTAGYTAESFPTPVKHWVLLVISDLYQNRSRSTEKPSVPQNFADELLSPYIIWSL